MVFGKRQREGRDVGASFAPRVRAAATRALSSMAGSLGLVLEINQADIEAAYMRDDWRRRCVWHILQITTNLILLWYSGRAQHRTSMLTHTGRLDSRNS